MKRIVKIAFLSAFIIAQVHSQDWRLTADSVSVDLVSNIDQKTERSWVSQNRVPFVLLSIPVGVGVGGLVGIINSTDAEGFTAVGNVIGGGILGGLTAPVLAFLYSANDARENIPPTVYDELPRIIQSPSPIYLNKVHDELVDVPLKIPVIIDKGGVATEVEFDTNPKLMNMNEDYKYFLERLVTTSNYTPGIYQGDPVGGRVLVHLKWEAVKQEADSTANN